MNIICMYRQWMTMTVNRQTELRSQYINLQSYTFVMSIVTEDVVKHISIYNRRTIQLSEHKCMSYWQQKWTSLTTAISVCNVGNNDDTLRRSDIIQNMTGVCTWMMVQYWKSTGCTGGKLPQGLYMNPGRSWEDLRGSKRT